MNKKLLGLAIFIVLAALIAAGVYLYLGKRPVEQSGSEKPFAVETHEPENGISEMFPQDLYIESGSNLLQNYESTTTEGGKQATVVTTTKKTLVKAVSDYVEFLKTKNWVEIESLFSQSDTSVIAVMKYGDDRIRITAQEEPETGNKIVEVTLTSLQKQK